MCGVFFKTAERRACRGDLQALGDEAELEADEEQKEEQDREADAYRERFYRTPRLPFVLQQEVKPGEQTEQDEREESENDEPHAASV